ncbi:uncharacterized protein DSM5745_09427 [Aspergillus mulundensis]|uniref:Uncharacterized protein n=1 Tax=Aspergillus mulundensis TaxID=1810919 RepID=A0A3D8QVG2_9EURO|nr:hypothetical protein DSM5745_09427 [Aspergillus mulundensis]RDW65688.1 hypothetical protein DSM5745_09427 [Aspergillus mulundensis]
MNQVTTGRLFLLFIQRLAVLEGVLATLMNKYIMQSFLSFFPQVSEDSPKDRDTADADRTADDWFDLCEPEPISDEPESASTFADSFLDGDRLERLMEIDDVDEIWYESKTHVRFVSEPPRTFESKSHVQLVSEPPRSEPSLAAPNKPLPALPVAPQSTAQRQAAMPFQPRNLSMFDSVFRKRSLSWHQANGYMAPPKLAPITWETSVDDEVCIEGRGPFWEGKGINSNIQGYKNSQAESAALLDPPAIKERSAAWEAELKLFSKSHETRHADDEITLLEKKLKWAEAEAEMYRDHVKNADLDVKDMEEQLQQEHTDLLACRERIARLEKKVKRVEAEADMYYDQVITADQDLKHMKEQLQQEHIDLSACRERIEYFEIVQGQWKKDHAELMEARVDMKQLKRDLWVSNERIANFEERSQQRKKDYAELKEFRQHIQDLEEENRELRTCHDRIAIIEDLQDEWKKDCAELSVSRERIADFEKRQEQWVQDHAELEKAREYIKELEAKATGSKCLEKRKFQLEIPPRTARSKFNDKDYARRRGSYDEFWAIQQPR